MFSPPLLRLAEIVLMEARENKLRIATAESCTGGLIASLLTEIPGSSDALDRGFVVYSNRAKQDMLGIPGDLIADMGAVSEPVARMMAEGAVENSNAHVAVAVTGVAGPGGAHAAEAHRSRPYRRLPRTPLHHSRSSSLRRHRPWRNPDEDRGGRARIVAANAIKALLGAGGIADV